VEKWLMKVLRNFHKTYFGMHERKKERRKERDKERNNE
jgi:hypothetical protein